MSNNFNGFDTKMVHAGYEVDGATKSVAPPIYPSNAYTFDDTQYAADLFSLQKSGNIYTRLQNPSADILEGKITALDGGFAALAFSSGHAAMFNAIVNLCSEGDEFVSSENIYGGAINMFSHSLRRLGITCKFVNPDNLEAWENAISSKTRLFFTELVGNPHANIADIEKIAEIAHKHAIPLMVDSTFNTPYLCKPIEFGADLVVHSATKYLSGHGQVMAGIIVDSGNFNYKNNERFPFFNNPDPSYHGLVFADLGKAAFIARLRALIMRDLGSCLSPFNAYLTAMGMQTLSLRMQRHSENALAVAEFLENHPKVEAVNCPMLSSSKYKALADKYLPKGTSGVFTFELKGGREAGAKFMDSLKLLKIVANVGDVRSQVIHPATTTHSQLTSEQLKNAGISENTVRLSIGIESIEDIIADIKQALDLV